MEIHLGHVITLVGGPENPELLDIPKGAVTVAGTTIVAVGEASDMIAGATIHDHGDRLIVPGLVDCHVHYPQSGMVASPGEELLDWLERYTFPAEARFADPHHAKAVAAYFTDRLIANGVTTALVFSTVHRHSVDALFHAARDRGLRLITGKTCMDRNAPVELLDTPETAVAESAELLDRWHGVDRLEYAITPRFAPTSSEAQLRALGELAADHPDVVVQTHLSENLGEIDWVHQLFPDAVDYTDVYDRVGLVRERSVFGHGVHLRNRELERLGQARASLAHCPTSNSFLGSGLFPLAASVAAAGPGLRIGLGSDIGAGTSLSPLTTAGEAYKVSRLVGAPLSATELLHYSTLGGAHALGLAARVGSIEPGKDADLVILDPSASPALNYRAQQCSTLEELLFAVFLLGDDRVIHQVVVNGKTVGDVTSSADILDPWMRRNGLQHTPQHEPRTVTR